MPRVNFLPFFVAAVLVLGFVRGFAAETNAAAQLVTAMAKLQATSYRKRDQMQGVAAKARMMAPMVTEYSGDRSRMVTEMNLPQFGLMRQEQITVGKRSAVRTLAPGLTKKFEDAKYNLSVQTARMFLQQIMQVATALETGGLSTVDLVRTAVSAGMQAKSTAEARAALDHAMSAFGSWREMKEEADSETPNGAGKDDDTAVSEPTMPSPSPMSDDLFEVTKAVQVDGKTIHYTKRAPSSAGMPAFYSVISVDVATGLPTSEVMFLNDQPMIKSEFVDIGAPISIEVPACLK